MLASKPCKRFIDFCVEINRLGRGYFLFRGFGHEDDHVPVLHGARQDLCRRFILHLSKMWWLRKHYEMEQVALVYSASVPCWLRDKKAEGCDLNIPCTEKQ
jgi:hypothetical protein